MQEEEEEEEGERAGAGEDMDTRGDQQRDGELSRRAATHQSRHCPLRPTPAPSPSLPPSPRPAHPPAAVVGQCGQHAFDAS